MAKNTRRYDFPDKSVAAKCHTHNLVQLMAAAGLHRALETELKANHVFANNWLVTKDWSVDRRYDPAVTQILARDLYSACTSKANGVLSWIAHRW